jgi:hypothetical protein
MSQEMDKLRSLVRAIAPEEATVALFAPSLATGVSDSDYPDAAALWGFELESGGRVQMKKPPPPMPTDEILEMLDEQQYKAFMAKRKAIAEDLEGSTHLPDGMDANQWIRSLQRELEDQGQWQDLDPLHRPGNYEWDGSGGAVESIAPSTSYNQFEFELRRLKLS